MIGRIQIYTGDGKGKTSAALGLVMRAVGAGLRVYLSQFMKGQPSSEIKVLRDRFPEVKVRRFGRRGFVRGEPCAQDIAAVRKGFAELKREMTSGEYDVVIADELNNAVALGLVQVQDVLELLDEKPQSVELILTGRDVNRSVSSRADLVTVMKNRKHYLDIGIKARKGIEM